MSSKKQIEQFMKRVKEKSTLENKLVLSQPPRLRKYYKRHQSNKDDPYAEGAYRGTLFEYFVTPLLILATHELSFVIWFVPSRPQARHLKVKQRKDRLSYDSQGQIIIQDGNSPAAEFDGIIRIGKKIFLIEIKYNYPKREKSIQKLISRLDFFNSAFKKQPHLLLIVAEKNQPFSEQENSNSHEKIHILHLPNFKEFRTKFEKGRVLITKKKLKKYESKLRFPHEVFPKSINFSSHRRRLIKAFHRFFKNEITIQEFFEKNYRSINLVGRIALGKISLSCDLGPIDSKEKTFSHLLASDISCIFCIKFRKPTVYPEIISCKKENKGRIPNYRRSTYDFNTGRFSHGKVNVTEGTLTYRLANQAARNSKTCILELKEMNAFIQATQLMTEYWSKNLELISNSSSR